MHLLTHYNNEDVKYFFHLPRKFPRVFLQAVPVTFSLVNYRSDFYQYCSVLLVLESHINEIIQSVFALHNLKKFIQVVVCIISSFLFLLLSISLYGYTPLVYPFICCWIFGLFPV